MKGRKLDCFVALLLAMTLRYESAFPRRDASELCIYLSPRGRRERRARDAPAALRAKINKAHKRSHHGYTGNTRHSPHNGFTVSFVLSPASPALLPPSSAV